MVWNASEDAPEIKQLSTTILLRFALAAAQPCPPDSLTGIRFKIKSCRCSSPLSPTRLNICPSVRDTVPSALGVGCSVAGCMSVEPEPIILTTPSAGTGIWSCIR